MARYEVMIERLKAMTRYYSVIGTVRSTLDQEVLDEAMDDMMCYQEEAKVTDRDLKVFGYITRNPKALIVADANILSAFNAAQRAVDICENDRKRNKKIRRGIG